MSAPPPSNLDANQVLQASFDDANGALRVEGILPTGAIEVAIDASSDNIAIKDPSSNNVLKINGDGSINVDLTGSIVISDVNITRIVGSAPSATNSLPVEISNGTSFVDPTQIRALDFSTDSITSIQGTSPWVISGTVSANQAGTWNINDITGAITLPTGASTSANQLTEIASLASIDNKLTSPIAVSQSGTWTTGRTWTLLNTTDSVNVGNFPATQSVTQGTSPWIISGSVTANAGTNLNTSALALDATVAGLLTDTELRASPVPVTGTITTSPDVNVHDGAGVSISSTGSSLNVDVTNIVPVSQSGSWSVTANAGTNLNTSLLALDSTLTNNNQATKIVNASGNAAAVQTLGTTPVSTDFGILTNSLLYGLTTAGGGAYIPIKVNPSGTITADVVGTVTANQGGTWNIDTITTVTNPVAVTQSTSPWVVSGTVPAIPLDGTKTTYSASITGLVLAATATDFFTITGSGTKTVKVTRVELNATATASAIRDFLLLTRSSANTGGTSTAPTRVSHDSNNAAATATVLAYTVNPTLGSLVGTIRTSNISIIKTGDTTGTTVQTAVWDFGTRPSQAITLRGTSQVLSLNFNGTSAPSSSFNISIEWTEE